MPPDNFNYEEGRDQERARQLRQKRLFNEARKIDSLIWQHYLPKSFQRNLASILAENHIAWSRDAQ